MLTEADKQLIINDFKELNATTILQYRKQQFERTTNNAYTFDFVDNKLTVLEVGTNKRVGYSNYNANIDAIYSGDTLTIDNEQVLRTTMESSSKLNTLVRKLLNKNIPQITSLMVSITDVINDPTMLSDNIIKNIKTEFGIVNSETTFMYLRKHVLDITNGKTGISIRPSGEYCFVNITPMEDTLKNKNKDIKLTEKVTSAKDIFNNKYMYGRLANCNIEISNAVDVAAYVPNTNTIYVNTNIVKAGGNLLKFALLHEFQHAIQIENNLNVGFDTEVFLKSSKTLKRKIVEDVKKHMPHLFTDNPSIDIQEQRVASYIYDTSSESMANGLDASKLVDFYPTIINNVSTVPNTDIGTRITFPWGSSYDLKPIFKIHGINITPTSLTNPMNEVLISATEPCTLEQFIKEPKSVFVTPSGELRVINATEHIDVITDIDPELDTTYWNTIPQVIAEPDFYVINITGKMSTASLETVLRIMDLFYDYSIDFTLGHIAYNDIPPDLPIVYSEDAKDSIDLLESFTSEYTEYQIRNRNNYTELGDKMSLAKPKSEKVNTTETKTEAKTETTIDDDTLFPAKETHKYISRTVRRDEKGEVVYRTNQYGNKVPIYDYVYPTENRYKSPRKSEGTPLENFKDKTSMAPELQQFIRSTKGVSIAPELQEKIDGAKKGTLTTTDIKDYIRDTDTKDMDETTFKLINDAFFHNEIITTPSELQKYMDNTAAYYAAAIALKGTDNKDVTFITNPVSSERLVESIKNAPDDNKAKQLYNQIFTKFYYKGSKDLMDPIDVSNKYLKILWLSYFDGSLETARKIANNVRYAAINNWDVTGEIKAKSYDESIGDDITLADTLEDKSALDDLLNLVLNSDKTKNERVLKLSLSKKIFDLIAEKYGVSPESGKKALQAKRIIDELPKEQLNELTIKSLLAEVLGLKFDTIETPKIDEQLKHVGRSIKSFKDNIRYQVNKIKNNLTPKQIPLFLKYNSDLFNDKLELRKDILQAQDSKGEWTYRDSYELDEVWARLKDISEDVVSGTYTSKSRVSQAIQARKDMAELNKKLIAELNKPVEKAKDVKVIQVGEDLVHISTNWSRTHYNNDGEKTRHIPQALEKLLDFEFSKLVKSKTQYLTNDTDYHFQHNMHKFLDENAELLESLSQQDVDEIVEFYTTSEVLPEGMTENKFRLYNAVQLYMSVHLLRGNKLAWFDLTKEQRDSLTKRTEIAVSVAAQELADWKAAMRLLKPEQVIIKSLARSSGIELNQQDVQDLADAIASGNLERITKAKKKAYENALEKYKGRKRSFWTKLYDFEMRAMLSAPGTWARNILSNTMLSGIYINGKQITPGLLDTADSIGDNAARLLSKVFPKKFKRGSIANQYKIHGTKITPEYANFIDKELRESGLLKELIQGISSNKYDIRKHKGRTAVENITEMICTGIATEIFNANVANPKLDKVYNFVFKMLSDEKQVTRNMLKYLGKMMVEDKTDISKGITAEISEKIANAYILAADDFMHKPNTWNKIDGTLKRNLHPSLYFAYKQFFPFAATSWNWFIEGLRYTPAGLAKAIWDFGRLEKTIASLEEKRMKGERVISSRFAEYTITRNIGKGVIGTIGLGIAALLIAFGIVKRDDKDKYVITINNTTIDFDELFGTQSIAIGLQMFGAIYENKHNDENDEDVSAFKILTNTLNEMLADSVFTDIWTTVRYNNDIAAYAAGLPLQVLNNLVPNFLKWLSEISAPYKVQYNKSIKGKLEQIITSAIPGLTYAMPKVVDIYTGENQVMYKANFLIELNNTLSAVKIKPLKVTEMEMTARELGVTNTTLSGKYTINKKKVNLKAKEVEDLNIYYGQLNKKDLSDLTSNRLKIKVKNDKGNYVSLYYKQMDDKQKKAAIEQIMSNNSTYAKVYILTSKGYKYYTTGTEFSKLRELGIIENVYRKTGIKDGFVEP